MKEFLGSVWTWITVGILALLGYGALQYTNSYILKVVLENIEVTDSAQGAKIANGNYQAQKRCDFSKLISGFCEVRSSENGGLNLQNSTLDKATNTVICEYRPDASVKVPDVRALAVCLRSPPL